MHEEFADEESWTLEQMQEYADARGVPGPNVDEHDPSHQDECFCRLCLSYSD